VPRPIRVLLVLVFFAVLLRTAWLSDDALITLRSVLNVTHGFGFTFNIDERVQTFTHPLWALLLTASYVVIGNVYFATFFLSIATSLVVFWMALGRAASAVQAWLIGVVLLLSRAFVDYSTSGLENPLSSLLVAAFVIVALRPHADGRPRLVALWTVTSLLYLARPDNVLFAAPILLVSSFRAGGIRPALRGAMIGLVPAAAWTAFSLVYYGFPFPNTAYAKLATGVPAGELILQGFAYLGNSLARDYVTLPTILTALVAVAVGRRRELLPIAAGILLSLFYVVKIGGDFMSGRFLTPALFCAVVLIWRLGLSRRGLWVAQGAVLIAGFTAPTPPPLSGSDYGAAEAAARAKPGADHNFRQSRGIGDARAFYYPSTGLLRSFAALRGGAPWPDHAWAAAGRQRRSLGKAVEIKSAVGMLGFFAGPSLHIVDTPALADPLLARLPAAKGWRIGHFYRVVPNGYVETLASGRNQICDEGLASYYDKLALVTRGRLLNGRRLLEIWKLNAGRYDALIDRALYVRLSSEHNDKGLAEYSEAELDAFLQADPTDAYALYKLGIAAVIRGEVERAIALWETAAREHPHDRCIRRDLALARQRVKSRAENSEIH
ncbi:MAG TPA: hypothetical protein VIY27_11680, partial [Myxococcota bacterium]